MELKQAEKIAVDICYRLQPFCEKINIAGSVRRKKKDVKDIEIICVPKIDQLTDMFGGDAGKVRSKDFVDTVNSLGTIVKGNAGGKYMQIILRPFMLRPPMLRPPMLRPPMLRQAQHDTRCHSELVEEDIMIDLFIPYADDYYRQYAIRTGSAEYAHKVIATAWKKKGWCGSDKGLRKISDCIEMKGADGKSKWKVIRPDAELPPVWRSEEEFFKWLKVPWEKPMHRL